MKADPQHLTISRVFLGASVSLTNLGFAVLEKAMEPAFLSSIGKGGAGEEVL
jgi:hypothetical protein